MPCVMRLLTLLVLCSVVAAAMSRADATRLLGLRGSFDEKELKSAYRKKSLAAHPDKGGTTEEFVRVAEAYEVLSGGGSGGGSFGSRSRAGPSDGTGAHSMNADELQDMMRRAEEIFDSVFDEFFSRGVDGGAEALVDQMFGDARGPFSWLLKKGLKKAAKAIGPALVSAFESDAVTINLNGMQYSGREFKEWRERVNR